MYAGVHKWLPSILTPKVHIDSKYVLMDWETGPERSGRSSSPPSPRLQAFPFWIVERVRETGARRNKREETGVEAGRKGTALLTVTNAFEFPVAPTTENSDWSINNSCCQTSLMCN